MVREAGLGRVGLLPLRSGEGVPVDGDFRSPDISRIPEQLLTFVSSLCQALYLSLLPGDILKYVHACIGRI